MSIENLRFREVVLQFSVSNILDRNDNAVAIGCDKDFFLQHGLGKLFLDRADSRMRNELTSLRLQYRSILLPVAIPIRHPSLKCQNLILSPLLFFFREIFEIVFSEILNCAIQLGAESLALPLIGTGGYGLCRQRVGMTIRKALETQYAFGPLKRITFVDLSMGNVKYLHSIMKIMVDNYSTISQSPSSSSASTSGTDPAQSSSNEVRSKDNSSSDSALFASFYDVLDMENLRAMREERLKEAKEVSAQNNETDRTLEACSVCLADMLKLPDSDEAKAETEIVKLNRCSHIFHRCCLDGWLKNKPNCPICNTWYDMRHGTQPTDGMMMVNTIRLQLRGQSEPTCLLITYIFPNGIQTAAHPRPGVHYRGIKRKCFLPDTAEGREVAELLRIAFDRRLTFTVGDSLTTGQQNVVVWNGIHHKTAIHGGPANYGYPDPDYLSRVKEELLNLGVRR